MRLFFLLLLTQPLFAGNLPTKYIGKLKGFAIEGLTKRQAVTLSTGTPQTCEDKVYASWSVYRCDLKNAFALITRPGEAALYIVLDKTKVYYDQYKVSAQNIDTILRRYTFYGTYAETSNDVPFYSKVSISVLEFDNNPGDLKGTIEFVDYNYSVPIQMVYQK